MQLLLDGQTGCIWYSDAYYHECNASLPAHLFCLTLCYFLNAEADLGHSVSSADLISVFGVWENQKGIPLVNFRGFVFFGRFFWLLNWRSTIVFDGVNFPFHVHTYISFRWGCLGPSLITSGEYSTQTILYIRIWLETISMFSRVLIVMQSHRSSLNHLRTYDELNNAFL